MSEVIIGALGALLVLAWVFGSLLALLPLITVLISVLTMQVFIYGLTYIVPAAQAENRSVADHHRRRAGADRAVTIATVVIYLLQLNSAQRAIKDQLHEMRGRICSCFAEPRTDAELS